MLIPFFNLLKTPFKMQNKFKHLPRIRKRDNVTLIKRSYAAVVNDGQQTISASTKADLVRKIVSYRENFNEILSLDMFRVDTYTLNENDIFKS